MSYDSINASERVLALISEADRLDINLDLIMLNHLFNVFVHPQNCAPKRLYGIYNIELLHHLTNLFSIGVLNFKRNKSKYYIVLNPNFRNVIELSDHISWSNISSFRDSYQISSCFNINQISFDNIIRDRSSESFEFYGDIKWREREFNNAIKYYTTALLWSKNRINIGNVFLDLTDIFEKTNNEYLMLHYSQKAINFFDEYINQRRGISKYSNQMKHIISFLSKFYKGIAESYHSKKINKRCFQDALIDYERFTKRFNLTAYERIAHDNIHDCNIFSTIFHDVGHCLYAPKWISSDIMDYLIRNNRFSSYENIRYFPSLFEFLSLINIQASMSAYFSDNTEDAILILELPMKLLSNMKKNPLYLLINNLFNYYKMAREKLEYKFSKNLIRKFDTNIRKASELIIFKEKENDYKKMLYEEFNITDDEAEDLLNLLNTIITETIKSKK